MGTFKTTLRMPPTERLRACWDMFATKTDPFSTKRMKCLQQLKGQATVEGWCAHQILNNDPRSKRKFLKFFILLSAKHCQIPATGSAGSCKFPMDPHTQVLDTDTGRVPTIGLAGIGRHKSAGPGTRSQHVFTTLVNPVPFLPCLTSVLEPHLLQVFLKMRSVGCKTCHTHCQSRLAKSAMNARRLKGAPIP